MDMFPLLALVSGFVGTFAMTVVMAFARSRRWVHLDFGELLGELFLPPGKEALGLGLWLHFLLGGVFALIYARVFQAMNFVASWHLVEIAGLFAVFHWVIAMGLFPLARILNPHVRAKEEPDPGPFAIAFGPQEAVWRLIAHIVYGCILGLTYWALISSDAGTTYALWTFFAVVVLYACLTWFYLAVIGVRPTGSLPLFTSALPGQYEARWRARRELKARLNRGELTYDEYQHLRREFAGEP